MNSIEVSNFLESIKNNRLYELSLEEMEKIFSLIDRNNDGFIDQREIFVAFNILKLPITIKEATKLLKYANGSQPGCSSMDFNDFLLLSCYDY